MIQSQRNINNPKKQTYSFKAINSQKVISLANSGQYKNNLVIQSNFSEDNQTFILVPVDQHYFIKCKSNYLYLTVENTLDGSKIYCQHQTNQPNQKFRIEETQPGSNQFIIYTFCGKVVDSSNEKNKQGMQKVYQNQFNGKDSQKWTLKVQTQFICNQD